MLGTLLGRVMETTLHRQLKELYAGKSARCEEWVEGYRIDAIARGRLIEIQQSSLSAIRGKVQRLVESHAVVVVKPLFQRKVIIRHDPATLQILSQRVSPQHQTIWDLFLELVHFVDVFPHPRLTLEVVHAEIEEHRTDAPGRRRRWQRRPPGSADRQLTQVLSRQRFKTAHDLLKLLPESLPSEFTSEDLATATGLPRWWAQKVAYCLRKMAAIETVGKRRHSWLYSRPARGTRRKAA